MMLHDVNAARDYRVEIFWSPQVKGFVAVAPDIKGCGVIGATRADVASVIDRVIRERIEGMQTFGDPLPAPTQSPYEAALKRGARS